MAKRLNFYDVKAHKNFTSQTYVMKSRMVKGNMKQYAVATSPLTGNKAWRVVAKGFKK